MGEYLLEISGEVVAQSFRDWAVAEDLDSYCRPIEERLQRKHPDMHQFFEQWQSVADSSTSFRFGKCFTFNAIDYQITKNHLALTVVEDDLLVFRQNIYEYAQAGKQPLEQIVVKTKKSLGPAFRGYISFGEDCVPSQEAESQRHFMYGALVVASLMLQKIEALRLGQSFGV